MADGTPISAMPSVVSIDGTETLPVLQGGVNKKALMSQVTTYINSQLSAILHAMYPVGSMYSNGAVSTNPNTLLGFGTWVAFGAGRMVVSVDGSHALGATGGEATHVLTTPEIPGHTHTTSLTGNVHNTTPGGSFDFYGTDSTPGATGSTGGGGAHNNMPPWIGACVWIRTA